MENPDIKELLKEIRKLKINLRRKATMEWKWVGEDIFHHQGVRKGLSIAYDQSAFQIEKILKKYGC